MEIEIKKHLAGHGCVLDRKVVQSYSDCLTNYTQFVLIVSEGSCVR